MDAFQIGVFVVVAAVVVGCCIAAWASSGRRLGEFGSRRGSARVTASELARRDAQDLQEMLDATNARRRARGLPDRSLADAMREFGDD